MLRDMVEGNGMADPKLRTSAVQVHGHTFVHLRDIVARHAGIELSVNAVRRRFLPPKSGTHAAARYFRDIDARLVSSVAKTLTGFNKDQQFAASDIKTQAEACNFLTAEHAEMISCDDKASISV